MKRTDRGDFDLKEFWFVRDVGKVREEAYEAKGELVGTEELADFVPGTGTCD